MIACLEVIMVVTLAVMASQNIYKICFLKITSMDQGLRFITVVRGGRDGLGGNFEIVSFASWV